ncbi:MAG: FAD-binding protein [Acidobacteria bacterium]|nr:FAD-binding protein [Acidobacteriota bacterium]
MSLVQLTAGAAAGQPDTSSLRRALEKVIEGEIRFDRVSRALYSTDASVYQIQPLGVVIPKHREDLLNVVRICHQKGCPYTLRGGGTSQAGQAIGEGLQVDLSKYYNRVLEVNAVERWVRVEPGIVLDELNAQLAPMGLRFAPDISTASRATIGGMMANNSSGARSVLYGKTIDHVIEMEVALSDGSIAFFREIDRNDVPQGETLEARCYQAVIDMAEKHAGEIRKRFPKILRRVGGYNLDDFTHLTRPVNMARMMVGSEGTLGVILEAKLKLVPLPKAKAVMVIEFETLLEALTAAPAILTHKPSAIEVMDKSILDNTRQNAALNQIRHSIIEGDPGATLCVEFYGEAPEDLPPRLEALEKDLQDRKLGYRYHHATDLQHQARIWSLREAALGLSMAVKEDAKSISDTAVAPEKLAEFIDRFLQLLAKHGTTAGIYAHASVGCLHVRPVVNMKTEAGVAMFEAIANDVAALVLEFGGALSGEHGDGLVRSPFMEQMFGPEIYKAFRTIKKAFDPKGLLNPGKIVDAPPLTSNLRFGPQYRAANPETFFDFSDYGGFAGAVEMCSGVGACRKKLSGTMCPSYMATHEEADSTRGRANVLRQAMAGELGQAGLTDQGVFETLDLCLECRACKSECPVGVDMAKYKSEFLAGYWAKHGTPLKVKLLGQANELAEFGSRHPKLTNAFSGIAARLMGIDPRRALPALAASTLASWFAQRPLPTKPSVLLFADTWTNYYQPEIGQAAATVFEAAGQSVALATNVCCGRPMISQGLLSDARAQASENTRRLLPGVRAGAKLVFCEPSCLSAMREDAPALLRGAERNDAEEVAAASWLFEDYLEAEMSAGRARLAFNAGPAEILVHGHCHQKAMGLLPSAKKLLSRIPGAKLIDPEAGCCGMAGSFGYATSKYALSKKIAEAKLVPAIRQLPDNSAVVASGFSCRHQVKDFASARAVHPAILLSVLLQRPR